MRLLVVALIAAVAGPLYASEASSIPVFQLSAAITLDGRVEGDPAWKHIPAIGTFHVMGSGRRGERKTTVRVASDATHLCIAFRCEDPNMTGLAVASKSGEGTIWRDDGVEVFVLPAGARKVFHVIVNAAGARTNFTTDLDTGFNPNAGLAGTKAAVFSGADFWSAEIAISFAVLGQAPKDGAIWTANFCRNIAGGGLTHTCVAPVKRKYCETDRFVKLIFHARKATPRDAAAASKAAGSAKTPHLVVHLPFDEGSGAVVRSMTANVGDGRLHKARWAEGRFDRALAFDGRSSYVEVPFSPALRKVQDAFTLEAWCYFDLEKLAGRDAAILSTAPLTGGFSYGYYLAYVDKGRRSRALVLGVAQDWSKAKNKNLSRWHFGDNAIAAGGWHHVVATFNLKAAEGARSAIFVDGRRVPASTPQCSVDAVSPGTFPLVIGAMRGDGRQPGARDATTGKVFLGRIDEVKVWNRALSESDVKETYGALWARSKPLSPGANARVTDPRPTFTWTDSGDGTNYILELANAPTFPEAATRRLPLKGIRYRPEQPLSRGVWYWRVWSTDAQGAATSACEPRAVVVSWQDMFAVADTTPPVVTDVRPARETTSLIVRPVISARWRDDTGLDLSSAKLLLDGDDVTRDAKITREGLRYTCAKPLRKGMRSLEISIHDAAGNAANRFLHQFSVITPHPSKVEIDADKRLRINGQAFYPVTLYSGGVFNHDFDAIARAGFNSIYGGLNLPGERTDEENAMLKAGIKNIGVPRYRLWIPTKNFNPEQFKAWIPLWDRDPTLIAYTLDEPNGLPGGLEVATRFYKLLKQRTNTRPALWILHSPEPGVSFGPVSDGLMLDNYPIGRRPILSVPRSLDMMRRALGPDKPIWFVAQAFDRRLDVPPYYPIPEGKTKDDLLRPLKTSGFVFRPTPREMRCMAYLALARDIQGIMLYAASGGPRYVNISDFPEDFRAFKKLAGELRHLAAMLAAPDAAVKVEVAPSHLGLHVFAKRYEGRILLIAVNPGDVPVSPTFRLPGAVNRARVRVLFENRAGTIVNREFTDLFEPLEVHVYFVE